MLHWRISWRELDDRSLSRTELYTRKPLANEVLVLTDWSRCFFDPPRVPNLRDSLVYERPSRLRYRSSSGAARWNGEVDAPNSRHQPLRCPSFQSLWRR